MKKTTKFEGFEIVYLDPNELIPYPNNARSHSAEQVIMLASMIKEFGFDQPIVIDSEKVIIKGHGRRLAALKLLLKKVPTITRVDLSPMEIKAARLADNRVGELSGWDKDFLKLEMETLKVSDFNLDLVGFDTAYLDTLLLGIDEDIDPDLDTDTESKTKEIDTGSFQYNHKCPKCGFEYNE
jgi:ParB-like chromosome segregation protein Spo0J